jgi:hypothetical protein
VVTVGGGEAAVVATRLDLDSLEMLPTEAVVTLAPTSVCLGNYSAKDCGYPNGSEEAQRAALVDGSTRGSLVLEGSQDGDRTGEGLTLNDLSAPEVASVVPADAIVKAMVWTFGVPHAGWTGDEPLSRGAILGKSYSLGFSVGTSTTNQIIVRSSLGPYNLSVSQIRRRAASPRRFRYFPVSRGRD